MSNRDQLDIENRSSYWSVTGREVTVAGLHCFVVVPYVFFIFLLSFKVLLLSIFITLVVAAISRLGYTPTIVFRIILYKLGGRVVKRDRKIKDHKIW